MSQPTEVGAVARLVTGDVVRFHLVGVKNIRQVVEALRSGRAFSAESQVITAGRRLVNLAPAAIVQLDLLSKAAVDAWTVDFSNEKILATQIEEEIWSRAREFFDEQANRRDTDPDATGEMITVLAEWRLADRRKLHARYELPRPRAAVQHDYLRTFFQLEMVEIDGLNGELIFVNPRQVVAASYCRGPRPDADAWSAQSFSVEP